jgi:L-rhamnose isomerase
MVLITYFIAQISLVETINCIKSGNSLRVLLKEMLFVMLELEEIKNAEYNFDYIMRLVLMEEEKRLP